MLSFSRVAHTFLNLTLSVEISDHRRHLFYALTLPRDQLDFCCPTWHLPPPWPTSDGALSIHLHNLSHSRTHEARTAPTFA